MRPYIKSLSLLLLVPFFVTGCASYRPRQMPVYLAEEVPYRKTVEGHPLHIGVQPLVTEIEQKPFFEQKLDKDVLPLLLIFDNKGKRSYRIQASGIELVTPKGEVIKPLPLETVYKEHFKKTVWSRVVAGFIGGAAIAVVTLLILAPAVIILPVFSALNTNDVNKTIRSDLMRKLIHNEITAIPNSAEQGLVFFPREKKMEFEGSTLVLRKILSYEKKDGPLVVEIPLI